MPGEKPELIIIVNSLSWITSNPEVITSPLGLVPRNALIAANSPFVGHKEAIERDPGLVMGSRLVESDQGAGRFT